MKKVLFVAGLLFLGSCDSDCCSPEQSLSEQLVGKWVAFESGGSDGSSYFVSPIPAEPEQRIIFLHGGNLVTNIPGFGSYFDIEIRTDTFPHPTIGGETIVRTDTTLTFYKSRYSRRGEADGFRLKDWEFRNGDLFLFPGCVEGCHLAFRRVQ